jgi:hypothetical protein
MGKPEEKTPEDCCDEYSNNPFPNAIIPLLGYCRN